MSKRGGSRSVTWYPSTVAPERPKNHGRKCECTRCKAAGVGIKVTTPDPQEALRFFAKRAAPKGLEVSNVPAPPPPPPPPPDRAAEKLEKAKRDAEAARLASSRLQERLQRYAETASAPPPGGFRAWLAEQRENENGEKGEKG